MGKEVVLFKSEEPKSLQQVAAFLRELADKLEGNEVVLRKGEEELALNIPNNVVFEVKAEEETSSGGKEERSLELEIEWKVGAKDEGPLTLG